MSKLPISVCLISGAEAHRIATALDSVAGWTSEMIVVLNDDVSDGTEAIARAKGAQVFREPWKGHIAQKNSSAAKATQPWILGLDADEAVSSELRAEIEHLFLSGKPEQHAAYSFPRLTHYCGRWIRHGDWYPDRQTRLWQRGRAKWGGIDPHDKLMVEGTVCPLKGNLLHHLNTAIDDQIRKIISYSNDFLKDARQRGKAASNLDLGFRPFWRFLRGYFLRLGFLDGWQGYYIAWMTSFHSATRYAKVRLAEQERQTNQPGS